MYKVELGDRIDMLMGLVQPERQPFVYHMLEARATREQVSAIYKLMDEVQNQVRAGTPLDNHEFERRVYLIIPSHNGDYHFAEGIISTLNDKGQYQEVFEYYKKHGMNL